MIVGWYMDEWYTWWLNRETEYAEHSVDIPDEMFAKYGDAMQALRDIRMAIDEHLMATNQLRRPKP